MVPNGSPCAICRFHNQEFKAKHEFVHTFRFSWVCMWSFAYFDQAGHNGLEYIIMGAPAFSREFWQALAVRLMENTARWRSDWFWYSCVPNRRACTFINFEKKIPPVRPYFGLHVYWFWEKIPPCTFIWVALKFKITSSKLKTACNFVKKSKFVINNSTDMSK